MSDIFIVCKWVNAEVMFDKAPFTGREDYYSGDPLVTADTFEEALDHMENLYPKLHNDLPHLRKDANDMMEGCIHCYRTAVQISVGKRYIYHGFYIVRLPHGQSIW
jgi:hypothetical protein